MKTWRFLPAAAAAALVLCISESAWADDADAPAPSPRQENWTLAAGLSLMGPSAGVGLQASDPLLSLMVERRLARPLWLLARVTGGFSSSEQRASGGVGGVAGGMPPLRGDSSRLGGALGLRWVFTPDQPFRFSTFLTGGVLHERSDLEPTEPVAGAAGAGYEGTRTTLGSQAGVAIDRELIEGLGLRLSAVIAYAGWSASHDDTDLGPLGQSETEAEGFTAGVTLSPAIELRFSF